MKIVIATPLYPPEVGGPAYYAFNLEQALVAQGVKVRVISYRFERKLPPGLRHILFFLRSLTVVPGSDGIIVLDTFSVGLPAGLAALIFRTPIIVRVGGDFLWEQYVARRQEATTLSSFYLAPRFFTIKEKIIFKLTKIFLHWATVIVFSTKWQADIWQQPYNISPAKIKYIENFYGHKKNTSPRPYPQDFILVWAGRDIFLKNLTLLQEAFALAQVEQPALKLQIVTNVRQAELFQVLDKASALILPSLSDISPNIVLEGLMFNLPMIVTKEMGLKDRLQDTVLYIDSLDISDIKEKILLLASRAGYEQGAKAAANFSFTHSYEAIAEEFINLFSKL
ncbi:MAG: hypothetical protein A2571_01340 [Candidatus Vogelbacteria bacterium RIFOXYD1_FULL_44_32]|uniref:Glycosyl transferase family 1 domain-containing protein n=1 Tax=Candidatus Vogelbacteria bacterium RIFOXYD1_FULL_44_32 TaxID=1802438 RepID=A0A1G2QCW2_9BACT|nr:MAG: hypothetical protein A2571_01340 [Candidatus Vogelbacteria bacterium RIFOXYD1_FULL_44_32]